ncbi:MAG: homoserine dehydrogenase [Deltaproteobacteria bacterium]|nr:homoserine dehydrogenase [Deltaproteobacteria bacterium]
MTIKKEIKIGLLGCGVVGSEVARLLDEKKALLTERSGATFILQKVLVRNLKKRRGTAIPEKKLTTKAEEVISDPEIDIIVELMGGIEPARTLILKALQNGKQVVTGNKALLAEKGKEIFQEASKRNRLIGFEASVAGGIPLLKSVSEGLIANTIQASYGIINGTSNFILSAMTERHLSFEVALKQAQEKGYAEADPTLDIDGSDAAHKLAILATLCYGVSFPFSKIHVEGIKNITPLDIEMAEKFGYRIKLLAISRQNNGKVELRVHPTMIRQDHPLASISGIFNAITLIGDVVGEAMFYGQGAGGRATASAVLSDIVAVARGSSLPVVLQDSAVVTPIEELKTEYYLRFSTVDKPGVLSRISGILGEHRISIASVYQHEQDDGAMVPIVIMTHESLEKDVQKALKEIDSLDVVLNKTNLIRVEKL